MSDMLRELVNQNSGLKLIELENMAVAPLIEDPNQTEEMAEEVTEFGFISTPSESGF